jgi:hypothetical protein
MKRRRMHLLASRQSIGNRASVVGFAIAIATAVLFERLDVTNDGTRCAPC